MIKVRLPRKHIDNENVSNIPNIDYIVGVRGTLEDHLEKISHAHVRTVSRSVKVSNCSFKPRGNFDFFDWYICNKEFWASGLKRKATSRYIKFENKV